MKRWRRPLLPGRAVIVISLYWDPQDFMCSQSQHKMVTSDQLDAPAALPREKHFTIHIGEEVGRLPPPCSKPWSRPPFPFVQSLWCHYTGISKTKWLTRRRLAKCGQEEGWDARQAATATMNDAPTPLNAPTPTLKFISCRRIQQTPGVLRNFVEAGGRGDTFGRDTDCPAWCRGFLQAGQVSAVT